MGFVGRVKDSVLALFGYPTKPRPEQVMDSMIATMSVNLRKSKGQVAIVLASQKRLQDQLHQNMNMVTQYQVKALAAVGRGEDELARDLLKKKKRYEETVEQLKTELGRHKGISDGLMEMVRKLELKLEETKRQKLLLLTQKQCFETSRSIEEGMEGLEGGLGFQEVLEDLEDDVNSLKYASTIGVQVEAEQLEDDTGEALALPGETSGARRNAIEDELEAMRERIATQGLPELPPETGAGGDRILHVVDEEEEEEVGIQILDTQGVDAPASSGRESAGRRPASSPSRKPRSPEETPQTDEEPEAEAAAPHDGPEDGGPETEPESEETTAEEEPPPVPRPPKKAAAAPPRRPVPKPEPAAESDEDDDAGIVFLS